MRKSILCALVISVFVVIPTVFAGRVDLTTYYPSPYGEYKNLYSTEASNFATSSGSVGIGTVSPGEKLEVSGNVKATAFFATASGAGAFKYNTSTNLNLPDYVFASDYKLMPLNELRNYVLTNKHLPGVLSAEELKNAGTASLVEQNFKNLEKIEELVLYVLQLKSETDALKARIVKLESKLNTGQ
ncbi:MAG: hypothetical protein WC530_02815 [Candidatus Omnitrophota bacterium]|jgi:hypothetical protein